MEAFCQKTHKGGYRGIVEVAFADHKRGPIGADGAAASKEEALGQLFAEYHTALFNTRRPRGKRWPGNLALTTVALRENTCRVEFTCYKGGPSPDNNPLCEPIAVEWALRDASGAPDAAAAEAAMETLIKKSLALCE